METKETKIDAILEAINEDIKERQNVAKEAMRKLEEFNLSSEEYKDANFGISANSFVASYLGMLGEDIRKDADIRKVENRLRFHSYQQHTKGTLDDGRDISLGQAAVATILDGYVRRFFE